MKTITISDEVYEKIRGQVETEKVSQEERLEIKNRFEEIIYTSTKTTLKEAVEEAVRGGVDLRGVDLRGAYLRGVNLRGVNLEGANLEDANLRDTDLRGADLRDANLRDTDLRGADLRGADLEDVNLEDAYLGDANLEDVNFYHAKFYGKEGKTIIKKNQVDNFLKALGVIVND